MALYANGHKVAPVINKGINPSGTINIAENGVTDVTNYASANVNVQPSLQTKSVTQNGMVTPDSGYNGLSSVNVNVPNGTETTTITTNGTYTPTSPNIGFSQVVVNVSSISQEADNALNSMLGIGEG